LVRVAFSWLLMYCSSKRKMKSEKRETKNRVERV
jgi:hypothetical protein